MAETEITVVYLLFRKGALQGAYKALYDAQEVYPGTWEEIYDGPIHAPQEWRIGDAKIIREHLR
jgi:hypothetical protein